MKERVKGEVDHRHRLALTKSRDQRRKHQYKKQTTSIFGEHIIRDLIDHYVELNHNSINLMFSSFQMIWKHTNHAVKRCSRCNKSDTQKTFWLCVGLEIITDVPRCLLFRETNQIKGIDVDMWSLVGLHLLNRKPNIQNWKQIRTYEQLQPFKHHPHIVYNDIH